LVQLNPVFHGRLNGSKSYCVADALQHLLWTVGLQDTPHKVPELTKECF
jgi:hypothetical protein